MSTGWGKVKPERQMGGALKTANLQKHILPCPSSYRQEYILPHQHSGPRPHGKESVLNHRVIQPPFQAGRAGADFKDKGQRIKALRRETQRFSPAGLFPPVTLPRG